MTRGRYAEARDYIENFLRIAREVDNQNRELTALNNLVTVLVTLGEYEAAREFGIQMLHLALEVGDRVAESSAYVNLAWGASAQEDWQSAEEFGLKGIEIKREIHQPEALAEALVWLGYTKLGLDQIEQAVQAFRESLEIRGEFEQEALLVESMSGLSRALLSLGDFTAAKEYVEKIMSFISRDKNLSGAWEPLRIFWNCYQFFKATDDPRKDELLKDAVRDLQIRAAKIPDETARERYLTNVPWHRELIAEWKLVRQ